MRYFYSILLFVILFGCKDNGEVVFYIISNDGAGLEKNSEILCKGVKIGSVDNVEIYRDKVLLTLTINSENKVPTNSQVLVGMKNMVNRVLKINYDTSNNEFVGAGDTLRLDIGYRSVLIEDGM